MLLFSPLLPRMVPGGSSVDLSEDSKKFNSHSPDPQTITKIVITASVVGWFVFGIISILVINGNGRAGRWVPEWYLDSRGRMKHKLAVLGWWVFVVLFWPLIWIGCPSILPEPTRATRASAIAIVDARLTFRRHPSVDHDLLVNMASNVEPLHGQQKPEVIVVDDDVDAPTRPATPQETGPQDPPQVTLPSTEIPQSPIDPNESFKTEVNDDRPPVTVIPSSLTPPPSTQVNNHNASQTGPSKRTFSTSQQSNLFSPPRPFSTTSPSVP
ncbi:hypothetical protein MRS44_005218 [Fusarium solani]|uniref:uncharacterized protein n=1 Tax=Fusarium solani TaxID=169388 RepID=UPI0032C494BE|nr:hypothetical protein MRS44_005218 [Fusarium solani]